MKNRTMTACAVHHLYFTWILIFLFAAFSGNLWADDQAPSHGSLPGQQGDDGSGFADIVSQADRISILALRGTLWPSAEQGPDFIAGYRWLARGADLAPETAAELKTLLFDKNSYLPGFVKKCPFVPEYAFRFHKGMKTADILVSFGCLRLGFAEETGLRMESIDPVGSRIRSIVRTVFRDK